MCTMSTNHCNGTVSDELPGMQILLVQFLCAQTRQVQFQLKRYHIPLGEKLSQIDDAVHRKEHSHLKSLGTPSPYMNYTFTQVNYRVDLVSVRSKGFPHSCNYQCIHDMVIHADAGL